MRSALRIACLLTLYCAPGHAFPDRKIAHAVASVSAERLRQSDASLVGFGTRSTFSDTAPAGRGVFAAREWIAAQFRHIAAATNGRMVVSLDEYVQKADGKRVPRDVKISSVVATLRGDAPDGRTYVMSSHYDSRNSDNADGRHDAPGADDNASGTAAVLEAARVLAAVPLHATLIFATFDGEEQGLFGSAHHAQSLRAAGVDVQGDLNNDIIGASVGDHGERNPGFVRVFSEALPAGADPARVDLLGNENDSPSRELARFAHDTMVQYLPEFQAHLIYRADRFLRGGDQESFTQAGFPAIRFVEPVETFAHQHQDVRQAGGVQYGDLMQFMDFGYLARVTQANVAVLGALAAGPGRPAKCSILVKELTNDTTLTWQRVPGATGYVVLRRLTTEPLWTYRTELGNVQSVTVPFSKDNWIFGVAAMDEAGHEGVAAYPLPTKE